VFCFVFDVFDFDVDFLNLFLAGFNTDAAE